MITTTKTTGAVHVHPLLKVEREARQLFLRTWSILGLSFDYEIDSGHYDDGDENPGQD